MGGIDQAKWKLDDQWTPKDICQKVKRAYKLLHGRVLTVENMDASTLILQNQNNVDFVYCDPPYLRNGTAWYGHDYRSENLAELRKVLALSPLWATSLDESPSVRKIFFSDHIETLTLTYTSRSSY